MISKGCFLGNEKVVRYLNQALRKGSVSHAYLFEGPEHIGKTTLAMRFASELLEADYDTLLKNPDLLFVTVMEDEKQIVIETIRDLQKDLSLYPFKAKYKVAIVEKAELMNRTAANALLKTLEEPGKTSVLILTSSDNGKMLSTIKSRCQIINLNTVPRSSMENFLAEKGESEQMKNIADLSDGRPGTAIALLENKELLQSTRVAKDKILEMFDLRNFKKLEEAAKIGAMDKQEAIGILNIWTSALRHELVQELKTPKEGQAHILKIKNAIEKIVAAKEDIQNNNVNLRLALENLCLSF